MAEQAGGTLVAERPTALIAEMLGSTSGLVWECPEMPLEAATCSVAWCHGIHAEPTNGSILHEKDIATATRDGKLVFDVSVHQSAFLPGVGLPNAAEYPDIWIHMYDVRPFAFRGFRLAQWQWAYTFAGLLRALGEYEFAGALIGAADLCQEIERTGK